jgi:hypothetical protein
MILGYLNPNGFLPSPVITVIEQNEEVFAIFPDLTVNRIADFREKQHSLHNFELSDKVQTISKGQYSYCIEKGYYITGSPLNIMLQLLDAIQSENMEDGERYKEIIREYLVNDDLQKILSQSKLDYSTCLLLSRHLPILKIILNKRKTKNKETASKLIVQYIYSAQVKTVYKKNIPYAEKMPSLDLKERTLTALINAVNSAVNSNTDRIKQFLYPSRITVDAVY